MKKQRDIVWVVLCAAIAIFLSGVFIGRATSGSPVQLKQSTKIEQAYLTNDSENLFIDDKMNINVATVDDLLLIPEIGEKTAQNIVAYRTENGPFQSLSDLRKVDGLNGDRIVQMVDYITVGGTYEDIGR